VITQEQLVKARRAFQRIVNAGTAYTEHCDSCWQCRFLSRIWLCAKRERLGMKFWTAVLKAEPYRKLVREINYWGFVAPKNLQKDFTPSLAWLEKLGSLEDLREKSN
jgi:hypothetical protein